MTELFDPVTRRNPMKVLFVLAAVVAGAFLMVFMTRNEGTPQHERREPLVHVKVAVAALKPVPVEIQAVGTAESYATVSIKSRVDGELVSIVNRSFSEQNDIESKAVLS